MNHSDSHQSDLNSVYLQPVTAYSDFGDDESLVMSTWDSKNFTTKGEQAAVLLRKMLLQSRWEQVLPGYRVLSRELGVGRVHVEAALAQLTKEGLLAPAERGKARQISSLTQKNQVLNKKEDKTILIIAPSTWDELPFSTMEVLRKVREQSNAEGYNLTYACINMIGKQKLSANLNRLIHDYQASHILLVTPTENLVMAASDKNLPFFCLGGEIPKEAGTCDAALVLIEDMILPALVHLNMQGHTKVLCPMQLGREMSYQLLWKLLQKESRISMTKEAFDASFPIQDITNPDVLSAFWEKNYTRLHPTAVILQNYTELLSFYNFCIKHRFSIPLDISVIALFDHPSIPWISPKLTRFVVPTQKMTRLILKWIGRASHEPQGTVIIPPLVIEGTTVASIE